MCHITLQFHCTKLGKFIELTRTTALVYSIKMFCFLTLSRVTRARACDSRNLFIGHVTRNDKLTPVMVRLLYFKFLIHMAGALLTSDSSNDLSCPASISCLPSLNWVSRCSTSISYFSSQAAVMKLSAISRNIIFETWSN